MPKSSTILTLIALLLSWTASAQTTRVRGRVTDASTGAPIAFASVLFPGTTVGITTDNEGVYALETRDTSGCVEVVCIGYASRRKPVRPHAFNNVDFALEPVDFGIEQIVITPGENPSHPILKEVIRRKKFNDPDRRESYICDTYTKMELDLSNVKPFKSKRFQKNFGFIFDYVDTSALTGRAYLPVMISETKADLYHSLHPSFKREVIRANRVSGIEDSFSIAQFTGQMHGNVNFYDNFIDIFNVRFASPLAESGLSFYDYFLVDSLRIEGRKTYKIRFHPKRLATPVLDGEIHIDSATYALQSASARMPKGVNVNWIKHLSLECENRMIDSVNWFRSRDNVSAEFAIARSDSSKMTSFIGTREIVYSDARLDVEIPSEILALDNNVNLGSEEVTRKEESYWEQARPYELSSREKEIYTMVDSVQQTPLYRNIYTVINTIVGGYYNTKYIGIGPYFKLLSFNRLEGIRPQIGGRTTQEVSRKVRLSGYAAYGTKDRQWKGGGSVELMFNRRLTRKLTLSGKHDVLQLGARQSLLSEGNLLSSIFSRGDQRLSMVDLGEILYEHEWRHGISNTFDAKVQRIHGNRYVPMFLAGSGREIGSLLDGSFRIGTRISKNENIYRQVFDKQYLGSRYPIFMLDLTAGCSELAAFRKPYFRFEGGIHYRPEIPPIGYSEITLQGGHILGTVPFPLLKLQEGNGTYFYDPYAFSCMNYYEFATDSWVALFFEHHFNGWLLGRIPLMKKLRWREVVLFKGVWGTLSRRNDATRPGSSAPLLFPVGMSSVDKPYLEAGVGIENICRFFRVDCIWRLTHRNPEPGQKVQNFSVNLSLRLTF